MNRQKSNPRLIIAVVLLCLGIFLFGLFRSEQQAAEKVEDAAKLQPPTAPAAEVTAPSMVPVNQAPHEGPNGEVEAPNTENLPEDLKEALSKPEPPLPEDMERQLKEPPPELPDDLKAQLNAPPAPLPPEMQEQLNAPPPPIPDDIKRAMEIPPQPVSIDEVNTPPAEDQNQ